VRTPSTRVCQASFGQRLSSAAVFTALTLTVVCFCGAVARAENFVISADGDLDWGPAFGGLSGLPSDSPIEADGVMGDAFGSATYHAFAGRGS
jgi:hypothetical protein